MINFELMLFDIANADKFIAGQATDAKGDHCWYGYVCTSQGNDVSMRYDCEGTNILGTLISLNDLCDPNTPPEEPSHRRVQAIRFAIQFLRERPELVLCITRGEKLYQARRRLFDLVTVALGPAAPGQPEKEEIVSPPEAMLL